MLVKQDSAPESCESTLAINSLCLLTSSISCTEPTMPVRVALMVTICLSGMAISKCESRSKHEGMGARARCCLMVCRMLDEVTACRHSTCLFGFMPLTRIFRSVCQNIFGVLFGRHLHQGKAIRSHAEHKRQGHQAGVGYCQNVAPRQDKVSIPS